MKGSLTSTAAKKRCRKLKDAMLLPEVQRAIRACKVQYFITLTTKEKLTSFELSKALSLVMRSVNRRLFGNRRSRRGFGLAVFAVQEESFAQGLHVHLIVGVPDGCLKFKRTPCTVAVPDLFIQTWLSGGDGLNRRLVAQNAKPVFKLRGLGIYVSKHMNSRGDMDNVDLPNTYIPTIHR